MSNQSANVPWRSTTLYVALALTMLAPLDVPAISPALPSIARQFGVSSARAGLIVTVFALPGIAMAPLVGVLADRFGRRRVVVPCTAVYGVAGLLVPLAGEFWVVLALRFVQGSFGGSILTSIAMTLVGDSYTGPRRNAVLGLVSAALSVSVAVVPVVGGSLAAVAWYAPFLLYGLALPVAAATALVLEEPDVERSGALDRTLLRELLRVVPVGRTVAVLGAHFTGFTLVFGGVFTAVPFLLSETYGLGSGRIGALLTGTMLVAAAVALAGGRLADRFSNPELIALGFLAYGAGFVGAWAAPSPGLLLGALGVFALGHGVVLPAVPSALSAVAPGRFRGGLLSLRASLVLASQAVGPLLFTVPAASVGYRPLLLGSGTLALAAGAVGYLTVR